MNRHLLRRPGPPLVLALLLGGCGVRADATLHQRSRWRASVGAAARQAPRSLRGADDLRHLLPRAAEVGFGFRPASSASAGAQLHQQLLSFRRVCPAAGLLASSAAPSDHSPAHRQDYEDRAGRWVSVGLARSDSTTTGPALDAVIASSRWCGTAFEEGGIRYLARWTARRRDPVGGVGVEVRQVLEIQEPGTDGGRDLAITEVTVLQRRLDVVAIVSGVGVAPRGSTEADWPVEPPEDLVRRVAAQVDRRLARAQRAG